MYVWVLTASFEFKNLNFNGYFWPFWVILGRFEPFCAPRTLTLTVKVVCMHNWITLGVFVCFVGLQRLVLSLKIRIVTVILGRFVLFWVVLARLWACRAPTLTVEVVCKHD